jgi:hypothetical protein
MLDRLSIVRSESVCNPTDRIFESLEPLHPAGPRISIYIPGQSASLGPAHRKVKVIKMLKQAERLIAGDHGVRIARELIARFWRTHPLGVIERSSYPIGYFHDWKATRTMPLPVQVQERVVVAESFHVKPLLECLQLCPMYYLISLSAKRVRLYQGTPWELKLRHAVGVNDEVDSSNSIRKRQEATKEEMRRFFSRAEKEIYPFIKENRSPVIVAGVSWLHPIFRRINRDPDLIAYAIQGNVEKWSEENLRHAALEALSKLAEQNKFEAIQEFQELSFQGRSSDDLSIVAKAAAHGKVKKIIVASDQMLFGKIDPTSGEVSLHSRQMDSSDDDVLDDLAESVFAKGGKVFCLPTKDLPTQSPVAAIFGT